MARASSSWPESTTTGTLGECSMTRRKVSAPRLSGKFRSSKTTEGVSAVSDARPSDNRLTQFTFTGDLPSIRRRRTRSASPGLSSISSILVVSLFIIGLLSSGWQAHGAEPELFNRLHGGKKIGQISRLADITVRAQLVTAGNILGKLGCTEDDNGNAAQLWVRLHRSQHRQAISFGQVQVQDHEVGTVDTGVVPPAAEKSERFGAIQYAMDLAAIGGCCQGFTGQRDVGGIIVHDENFGYCIHARAPPFSARRGIVNLNVDPDPASDSTQILPP